MFTTSQVRDVGPVRDEEVETLVDEDAVDEETVVVETDVAVVVDTEVAVEVDTEVAVEVDTDVAVVVDTEVVVSVLIIVLPK